MKQNNIFTAEETLATLGHLAWCALVALRLAQRDGQALAWSCSAAEMLFPRHRR
ncbi:hypothetical protein [Enterobacter asburiae]|uniref:hypothetical protein n=1 Tax=Enterobacter asburiae TaxID=61645 RepID=UPI00192B14BE|nr:hypothetical protein [Enterobacter asburiae]